jgi:hypothetical protein
MLSADWAESREDPGTHAFHIELPENIVRKNDTPGRAEQALSTPQATPDGFPEADRCLR